MKKSSFILSALLLASALFTAGCSLNAKSEPIPFKSNYDKVQYKMVCYFQDIGSPSYSINKKYTKTYSGKPGEMTAVVPPTIEGFTLQAEPTQVPIAGDYTTVVEVTYSRNFYYVYYDTNGGNTMYSSFFQYGSKVNITQKPVRNGYTFTGWNPEIPATMPAHDITLKAQWIEGEATPYKVEHYLQNADDDFYTLDFTDDKAGRTNSQTKAAAKKYPNFTAQPFNQESISPEGDTVVLIFYNRKTFTIKFDTNGGSNIAPAEYKFEQTVIAPTIPTKTGYTFKKWEPELPAAMPDEDIETKAVWEANVYNITYKDQFGNDFSGIYGTDTPITHTYDSTTTLVEPTKQNNLFLGWYLDSNCETTEITKLEATDFTDDITLFAKWTDTITTSLSISDINDFLSSITNKSFIYEFVIDDTIPDLSQLKTILNNNTDIKFSFDLSECIGLKTVDNHAFYNCTNLYGIELPDSVTSIGSGTFYNCSDLTSVTIPSSVTSIGNSAFNGCSGLTSVTIPVSVTSIGDYAFCDCSGLTSVTIPTSVTSIGSGAFFNCSGLTSVTIPTSVTSIGVGAFYGCSRLTSITFEETTNWYRTAYFSDWENKTGGTLTNISTPSINATNFTSTSGYYNYYWYKLD